MRQLAYTSMQGAELLFPSTSLSTSTVVISKKPSKLFVLEGTGKVIQLGRSAPPGRFRLHNETFWLGWSASARYGWNPGVARSRSARSRIHAGLLRLACRRWN